MESIRNAVLEDAEAITRNYNPCVLSIPLHDALLQVSGFRIVYQCVQLITT